MSNDTLAMIERALVIHAETENMEELRRLTSEQQDLFFRLVRSDADCNAIAALSNYKERVLKPALELPVDEYTRLLVGGIDAQYQHIYPEFLELKAFVKNRPPMKPSVYKFLVDQLQENSLRVCLAARASG